MAARQRNELLKDLFNLPSRERYAFLFVLVMISMAAAWVTYEQWFRPAAPAELAAEKAMLAQWIAERDSTAQADSIARSTIQVFAFDPNKLPIEQWMALGLSRKQAETIHRYEEHGGTFRSKADLSRMRVIRPDLLAQWWSYIQLPDSSARREDRFADRYPEWHRSDSEEHAARKQWKDATFERPARTMIELNAADTLQLLELPGVGASTARAIVKFRDKLGGFHSLEQLGDVYLLKQHPENIDRMLPLLTLDTLLVRKIPINTCNAGELMAHPYASKGMAKALVAYRQQHGPFSNVEGIKGCVLVTDSVFVKLAPYLKVE